MLEEDARSSSLLDGGIAHVAGRMLERPRFEDFGPYRIRQVLGARYSRALELFRVG